MARSISVKIPTATLIAQIEERIAEIDKEIEEYPAKRQQYEKDLEAYKANLANFIAAYVGENLDKVGYNYDDLIRINNYGQRVELSFFPSAILGAPRQPQEPEAPNQNRSFGREWTTQKAILEKNLKILKMTTQEEVSASTYGAIMEII